MKLEVAQRIDSRPPSAPDSNNSLPSSLEGSSSLTYVLDPLLSSSLQPPEIGPYVQLCPHETLSFERFQHILALPGFRDACPTLDALAVSDGPHYKKKFADRRSCRLDGEGSPTSSTGSLSYRYDLERRGLVLKTNWTFINSEVDPDLWDTERRLRRFFKYLRVSLCPHENLGDTMRVKRIFDEVHSDAGCDWREDKPVRNPEGDPRPLDETCLLCGTTISIHTYGEQCIRVATERFLGDGRSEEDPFWLLQCVSGRRMI